jgi:hypothetical protein
VTRRLRNATGWQPAIPTAQAAAQRSRPPQ